MRVNNETLTPELLILPSFLIAPPDSQRFHHWIVLFAIKIPIKPKCSFCAGIPNLTLTKELSYRAIDSTLDWGVPYSWINRAIARVAQVKSNTIQFLFRNHLKASRVWQRPKEGESMHQRSNNSICKEKYKSINREVSFEKKSSPCRWTSAGF